MDNKRRIVVALAMLLPLTAHPSPKVPVPVPVGIPTSPIFKGEQVDVWLNYVDGSVRTLNVGGLGNWVESVQQQGGSLVFGLRDGADVNQALGEEVPEVLINQAGVGLPGVRDSLPAISLTSFSRASSVGGQIQPWVSVEPPPGSYTETIAVELRAQAAPALCAPLNFTVHWSVDGIAYSQVLDKIALADEDTATVRFWLARDGAHSVTYRGEQCGYAPAADQAVVFNIASDDPLGERRDSDGDGIPDLWEIAHGLDPLDDSRALDSDGDGWSDFDEIVRGTDPGDAQDAPADSDGDGWSDFDEGLRGTDPNDIVGSAYPDKPVARSLHGVEYLLEGKVWADADHLVQQPGLSNLTVHELSWDRLYAQNELPGVAELAALQPPLGMADLPGWMQATAVGNALALGNLPPLRLPASSPLILGVNRLQAGEPGPWRARAWVGAQADLDPGDVTEWLTQQGTPWSTPEEWQAGWSAYLAAQLVQTADVAVAPDTSVGISLLEGAIRHRRAASNQALLLLGERHEDSDVTALDALRQRLADQQRDIEDLHADLLAASASGEPLEDLATAIVALFTDGVPADSKDTAWAAARLVQTDEADAKVDYLARLLALHSWAELGQQSNLSALFDPLDDFDSDGVLNLAELTANPDQSPLHGDTDGDGVADSQDACPADAADQCLVADQVASDSDGDGVDDRIDNCPTIANRDQEDSKNHAGEAVPDGIGDACNDLLLADILQPVGDIRVAAGQPVQFIAELSTGAEPGMTWQWTFADQAAASDQLVPEPVRFPAAGTWPVGFHMYAANGALLESHQVQVNVLGKWLGDALPVIQVSDLSVTEGDDGVRDLLMLLTLSSPATDPVSIDYRTQGVSASGASDYVPGSGTLTIPAGQSSVLFSVALRGDTMDEADEALDVLFDAITNAQPADVALRITIEDDDAAPVVRFVQSTSSALESDGSASVQVELVGSSAFTVSVPFSLAGSATAGDDYNVQAVSPLQFPAGSSSRSITFDLNNDGVGEGDETIEIVLDKPDYADNGTPDTHTLTLGDAVTLGAMNDSGQSHCATDLANDVTCPDGVYAPQDADHGRDGTDADDSDGRLGFSFVKLAGDGQPLVDQQAEYALAPWDCVHDNVTGLTWEIKSTDGSLHDAASTFSWYEPAGDNGGLEGTADNGVCKGGIACDTSAYRAAVNAAGLCGYDDWRVPTVRELVSILDYGRGRADLPIDDRFFSNLPAGHYWSRNPLHDNSMMAWTADIGASMQYDSPSGGIVGDFKDQGRPLMLVRGDGIGNQLVDNKDGTVSDLQNRLMWQRCMHGEWDEVQQDCVFGDDALPAEYTWKEAMQLAAASSFAGYNDWRLPTLKELLTVIDHSNAAGLLDAILFPRTDYLGAMSNYLTATPVLPGDTSAEAVLSVWSLDLNSGSISYWARDMSYGNRIWMVRDLPQP